MDEESQIETRQSLWEILVPTVRNDGRPFRLRYHRVWDERVKAVSGGLTVVQPVRGTWISPTDEEFKERMIPVRIMCTRSEIMEIARMSKIYYEQEAIMVYRSCPMALLTVCPVRTRASTCSKKRMRSPSWIRFGGASVSSSPSDRIARRASI